MVRLHAKDEVDNVHLDLSTDIGILHVVRSRKIVAMVEVRHAIELIDYLEEHYHAIVFFLLIL